MSRTTIWRCARAFVLATLAAGARVSDVAPAAAQDKDTLWTRVTATGDRIILSWEKRHPWDASLNGGGLQLIARYRAVGGREMTEAIGRVTVDARERHATVTLPEQVRQVPAGPICLSFQLSDRRMLPVRRAGKGDSDTAGMSYGAWDLRIRQRLAAQRVSALESTTAEYLRTAAQNVETQRAVLAARGWDAPNACASITLPAQTARLRPYDVVPPEQHDDIARRTCVRRAWVGQRADVDRAELSKAVAARDRERALGLLVSPYTRAKPYDALALFRVIADRAGAEADLVKAYAAAAQAFAHDWERWAPGIAAYTPHLGAQSDALPWSPLVVVPAFLVLDDRTVAKEMGAAWALDGVREASLDDYAAVIGAAFDSYGVCVDDSRKQLRIKYDSWTSLQQQAPARATAEHDFLVRDCQKETARLDELVAKQREVEAQREEQQRRRAELAQLPPWPTKPRVLNDIACGAP